MPFPLKKLRKCLTAYEVWEEPNRGKGSHTMFFREIDGGKFSYPVPTQDKEVPDKYVKGARKQFRLMPEDGVSDDEFFSRA